MNDEALKILNRLEFDGNSPIEFDEKDIKAFLPKGVNPSVSKEIVLLVNNLGKDTGIFQNYMISSFIDYLPALKDVKVSLAEYTNALKYVTLKQRMTNVDAWKKTFPRRHQAAIDRDNEKGIEANVSVYNNSKIVHKLEAMMILDIKVQYASVFHKAIQKNISLMDGKSSPNITPFMRKNRDTGVYEEVIGEDGERIMNVFYPPVSAKVQQDASNTLIELLKPTDELKVNHQIGFSSEIVDAHMAVANSLSALAFNQRKSMIDGAKIEDVQVIGHVLDKNKNEKD